MALATPERRFQSEWGTKPSSLVEVISGLLASDLRVGEYKAKVKRRVTRDSFRTVRVILHHMWRKAREQDACPKDVTDELSPQPPLESHRGAV